MSRYRVAVILDGQFVGYVPVGGAPKNYWRRAKADRVARRLPTVVYRVGAPNVRRYEYRVESR